MNWPLTLGHLSLALRCRSRAMPAAALVDCGRSAPPGRSFSDDLALAQSGSDNDTDDNQIDASPRLAHGQEALGRDK
jgi:hypothetical protein